MRPPYDGAASAFDLDLQPMFRPTRCRWRPASRFAPSMPPPPPTCMAGRSACSGETTTRGSDGTYFYEAQVVCQSFEFIERAVVHLALVDENQRIFARMDVPIALLSGQKRPPAPRA